MDVNPENTTAPELAAQLEAPIEHPFALADAAMINLVAREDLSQCSFWLGVFQRGTLNPASLLDSEDIAGVFLKAATDGITEQEPIMLSDSLPEHPRFFYFVPAPAEYDHATTWTESIAKTLIDLKLPQLGIYFAPELLTKSKAQTLLKELMTALIKEAGIKQYHLYTGGHGSNPVLNAALELKNQLETDAARIFVFH